MKINVVGVILLSCLSLTISAKAPNPLCAGVTGANFTSGNGTVANPFLICNQLQINQISTNQTLLSQSFVLGADLDFHSTTFVMIGSVANPFQGTFTGNGYTLSAITLPMGGSNISIFPHIQNATINNLLVSGVTISGFVGRQIGGLVGLAENSTLSNIRISNLNMNAPDRSGGLVGDAENSTITNCSTRGVMNQYFGTDSSGGLIGWAFNSHVSTSASHVNLVQSMNIAYGVSGVGGLFGAVTQGTVTDCYADGNIDYSAVKQVIPNMLPKNIGGITGTGYQTSITNAYYAGKIIVSNAKNVGGSAGLYSSSPFMSVFWDTKVSGSTQSGGLGVGEVTCLMTQKSFWLAQGFNPAIWTLVDGRILAPSATIIFILLYIQFVGRFKA